MNVSSASSSLASLTASSLNKSEQVNEGTKPDGDGDSDDAVQAAATVSNAPVGASGNNINTFA